MSTYADIQARIDQACRDANRSAQDVNLVAVCKNQPAQRITQLLEQGHRVFGENKVQEAAAHWSELRLNYPDAQVHFIGHLQSNKAKGAVALFDMIETVDRPNLADALAREMKTQNKIVPCLIQVNTGEEAQKGGVLPGDLADLIDHCRDIKLQVSGLMCIPPVQDVPDLHFALLHKLAAQHGLPHLSMGMSDDFEAAIHYGSTHVRIGRALFGARASQQ